MDSGLRAPRTLSEWRAFTLAVIAGYAGLILLLSREPFLAAWMGVYAGAFCVATVAVAVFTVRGVRDTLARSRE